MSGYQVSGYLKEPYSPRNPDDFSLNFLNLFPRDGHGQILFGEFVSWALEKNLDIEDDID